MSEPQTAPRAEILRTKDFIGWTVSDARGAKVGTVDDLLIDRGGRVRYLSVNPGLLRKNVLLPARLLEWAENALVLAGWSADEVKHLPPYDPALPLSAEVLAELESAHPRFYAAERHTDVPPRHGEEAEHIVPLKEARDFRLSKDATDPRGWTVFGADGERAGTVVGMLVDPIAMKVRYLEVDLADDLFLLNDDRHVVVPTERVELRDRGQDAWISGLAARELASLPAYTGGALDPLVRARVDHAFAAAPDRALPARSGANDAPALPSGASAPGAEPMGEAPYDAPPAVRDPGSDPPPR